MILEMEYFIKSMIYQMLSFSKEWFHIIPK